MRKHCGILTGGYLHTCLSCGLSILHSRLAGPYSEQTARRTSQCISSQSGQIVFNEHLSPHGNKARLMSREK